MMIPAGQLNSAHLKKLLAIEEAQLGSAAQYPDVDDGPSMMSLRSPTTRTLYAIHRNNTHFESVRAFLSEAEAERDAFLSLVDEADKLRDEPIINADAALIPARGSDAQRTNWWSHRQKDDSDGDDVEGQSVLKSAPNAPAEGHEGDLEIASRITFTYPRDAAGTMIPLPPSTTNLAAPTATTKSSRPHLSDAADAQHGERERSASSSTMLVPPMARKSASTRTAPAKVDLRALMSAQREELAATEVAHDAYLRKTEECVQERQRSLDQLKHLLRLDREIAAAAITAPPSNATTSVVEE